MTGEKVNFEEVKERVDNAAGTSRKHERSTIDFPYLPLEAAVEVALAVYSRNGFGSCEVDELAAEMGQTVSGAFRQKTAAAKTFGLVEKDGRSAFKLSDLGRGIVDEATAQSAKVDAFFAVPLYSAIYDNYRGQKLPPSKALEREMQSLGVAPKQTDRARQAFERSAHYAGMHEAGNDRLVKPNVSAHGAETSPPPPRPEEVSRSGNGGESGGGEGGNGSPPTDLDPIVAGLVAKLPKAGEKWPSKERSKWLATLGATFDYLYGDDDDDNNGQDHSDLA